MTSESVVLALRIEIQLEAMYQMGLCSKSCLMTAYRNSQVINSQFLGV